VFIWIGTFLKRPDTEFVGGPADVTGAQRRGHDPEGTLAQEQEAAE